MEKEPMPGAQISLMRRYPSTDARTCVSFGCAFDMRRTAIRWAQTHGRASLSIRRTDVRLFPLATHDRASLENLLRNLIHIIRIAHRIIMNNRHSCRDQFL